MSNEILKLANIKQKIFNSSNDVTMKSYTMIKERTESIRHLRFAILELFKSILLWFCIIERIIDNIAFHLLIKGYLGKKQSSYEYCSSQILKEVNITVN